MVKKRDGALEPFSAEKLENSIRVACGKRPVSGEQIAEMVRELSENWASQQEVESEAIGKAVMEALKEIDHVAFIRFASVYRQFKDVDEFKREISGLFEG
jgi:transcriptional repressor NrdR